MLRRTFLLATGAMLGMALSGCSSEQEYHEVRAVDMAEVKASLEKVAAARVLLGHQSVGRNILAGIETLSKEAGVPIRIVEIDGVPPDDGPGLFHSHIGKNGDPEAKCEAFEQLLVRPERPAYDAALMKFCYVDLKRGANIEAQAMLDRYTRTVQRLAEQRPDVRLVHVSLPVVSGAPNTLRTKVKRLIGRDIPSDADNALRNAFNDKLRERYGSEPFFDLAALESTYADGSRSSFTRDGKTIYTLAREYTYDGGHLNEVGQRLAAAELLRTLAAVVSEPAT
jgi:lysophospholipase L1-like esterase